MTTLGFAIVLATILYIIDRNHVWPQVWKGLTRTAKVTARICLVLIAGGVVTYVIFYTWGAVKDAREKREWAAEQKATEAKANQAIADRWAQLSAIQKQVCDDKFVVVYNDSTIGAFPDNGEVACATTSGGKSVAYSEGAPLSPQGCAALQKAIPAFTCKAAPAPAPGPWVDYQPPVPPARRLRALYGVDLVTTMSGNLKCGHVDASQIVTFLDSNDIYDVVKVRTASGITGWANQNDFEVVNR
jgi:hypothetical protein